jgi:hypothetical protein
MRRLVHAAAMAFVCALSSCGTTMPVFATWKPQYANADPAAQDWYKNAELTEAAEKRLGFKSCCAHSDVVRTRFRPAANGDDGWEYVDGKGQWVRVPDDIIHHDQFAPGGQPIMFAIGGLPTCFFKPQGGI